MRFFRPAVSCCLALSTILFAGCDQSPPPAKESTIAVATPEDRFANLLEALNRRVEDSGMASELALNNSEAPPGTPVTEANTKVGHELIAPAESGEPYRASITLTTKSTVTMVLQQQTEADKEAEKAQEELGDEIEGIPPLDSLIVPKVGSSALRGSSSIKTFPDELVSTYEFEYRGDRWELLTELDREKEPFNAVAIEYALMRQ